MSSVTRVVRIPRSDEPDERLLLHVSQTGKKGPLDLKLIATEHEHLYHAEIESSKLSTLKAEQFGGDDTELRSIFSYLLLAGRSADVPLSTFKDVAMLASMEHDSVRITIRRSIDGITQHVASITLKQDDEREEVSPFSWVDDAVAEVEVCRAQIEELQTSLSTFKDTAAQLQIQMDEFIQTKKDHDEELLQQFAALLNSKKRKIRELQGLANGDDDVWMSENQGVKRAADEHIDGGDDAEMDEEQSLADDTPPLTDDERLEQANELPPRRELPFSNSGEKSTQAKGARAQAQAHDQDDGDETEDEL